MSAVVFSPVKLCISSVFAPSLWLLNYPGQKSQCPQCLQLSSSNCLKVQTQLFVLRHQCHHLGVGSPSALLWITTATSEPPSHHPPGPSSFSIHSGQVRHWVVRVEEALRGSGVQLCLCSKCLLKFCALSVSPAPLRS